METIVTLWFVTAAEPERVLEAEHPADRGYGRKYLAQLNPAWPITPIGQFPLNRSTSASHGEFYVGGFPGVTVVQTVLEDTTALSEIPSRLLDSVPAAEVYAFAVNHDTGYGGMAHWRGGVLKRSLCATRTRTYEDIGLPERFESPFWAGERAESIGGIALPFEPIDLVAEAERQWLGVEISPDGPDIHVVAYAIDGRPEPRLKETSQEAKPAPPAPEDDAEYDDYEDGATQEPESDEFAQLADASTAALKRVGRGLQRRFRTTRDYLTEKLRHSDRD